MKVKAQTKLPEADTLPNLYLVGFMGTGKSVIGMRLAQRFGMRFIDSDSEIERKYGMKVHDIFADLGEARFREMEKEFIESGHPLKGHVVACGGGLVCQDGMSDIIKKKGIVAVLFADPDTIFKRVSKSTKRPLLNVENPLERIKTLMAERQKYYLKSGICVSTLGRVEDALERVARIYIDSLRKHKK